MADTITKDVHNVEMESAIKELKEYKILKKQAEDRIKALEGLVKDFMDEIGETDIACGQYTCKLTEVGKSTFDKDIIKLEAPELYERATGTTTYRKLTIK